MPNGNGLPRTYSIAADTGAGVVNRELLANEIDADVTIVTARRLPANGGWKDTAGDVMDLWFAAALSGAEQTALDAVVAAHNGTVTTQDFQFWEKNAKETTVDETWDEKMSRTAASMRLGTYKLSWYFELKLNPTGPLNSLAMARFLVDANVKGSAETVQGSTLAGVGWVAFSGWDRFIAAEGITPVLSLEIQRDSNLGGNDTVEIRKMKLGIEFMG